jgi:hypothetical protein
MLVARVMIRFDGVAAYAHALDGLFASLRPALLERRRSYFAIEGERLAAVIRAGQRAGELAPGDAHKSAELLLLCTNALLPHGLSGADIRDRAHVERRARTVATLLLDGLRRRKGTSS